MQYKILNVSKSLQPYVKHIWFLKANENDIPFSQQLVPFGSHELTINLLNAPEMQLEGNGKLFVQPNCFFTGQFTKPFLFKNTKPFSSVGITMQPWAGNLLFSAPSHIFTNNLIQSIDANNELQLREKMLDSKEESDIALLFENYILEKLKNYQLDSMSAAIAKAVFKNPSGEDYKHILSNSSYTRRRVEQRFLESTGLPIGNFVRKMRFQKVVSIMWMKNIYL